MLRCRFDFRREAFTLSVQLDVEETGVVAVVGPNGAGKSTLLRILAGLETPEAGSIRVGETSWLDVPGRVDLRPEDRDVGYMPQGGLLFPHLSVRQNIEFGRKSGQPDAAGEWMDRLGLVHLADERPTRLSGGQTQLVAFARAQVRRPAVLLLDEPLAFVDVGNRAAIRRILRRELRARPGYRIFVTHDPVEAAALADRIVVLDRGRIVQEGTIDELRSRPRSTYVAELVGVNFFRGVSQRGIIELDSGGRMVAASAPDGPVVATIHPRAVSLYREQPSGSPRNVWMAPIVAIEPSLEQVRMELGGTIPIVAEVTRAGASQFREGDDVWVAVKASEVQAHGQ